MDSQSNSPISSRRAIPLTGCKWSSRCSVASNERKTLGTKLLRFRLVGRLGELCMRIDDEFWDPYVSHYKTSHHQAVEGSQPSPSPIWGAHVIINTARVITVSIQTSPP